MLEWDPYLQALKLVDNMCLCNIITALAWWMNREEDSKTIALAHLMVTGVITGEHYVLPVVDVGLWAYS